MLKPRSILIYGESGSTKTSQCYHLAKWIHAKTGLTGRFIGSSGSDLAPYEDSGMLEKGVVDFFDVSQRELALADMRRLSQGYWPRTVKGGPEKGYFHTDEQCKTTDAQWNKIGFYIVEGINGISNLLANHMREQEEGVGFKHSYKYVEDGYVIGGLDGGHYGLIQKEIYKIINQGFLCLPVKYIIFTSLVSKGEVDSKTQKGERGKILQSGETIYGPKSAGQATTFEIPSWFMDTFHLDKVVVDVKDKETGNVLGQQENKVAWFIRHPDLDTGIDYLAKPRILPELYPKLLERFPDGYVTLGFKRGLDKFYEYLDGVVGESKKGMMNGAG